MAAIDDLVREIFGPRLRRHRRLMDLDLTLGQLECLRLIGDLGTPSMSELAAELDLRPSTVTGLVDSLVQRGKVERVEDATDRRIVRVQLTAEGLRERETHREHRRQQLMELLGEVSEEDLRRVYEALRVLQDALLRHSAEKDTPPGGSLALPQAPTEKDPP